MDRSMTDESGLYQNMNNGGETIAAAVTQNDTQQVDSSQSRRVSSIYEEIADFKER